MTANIPAVLGPDDLDGAVERRLVAVHTEPVDRML